MNNTQVVTSVKNGSLPKRPFSDFAVGDIVIGDTDGQPNGAVGVKIGPNQIRWFVGAGGWEPSDSGVATIPSTDITYLVPKTVNIAVTI